MTTDDPPSGSTGDVPSGPGTPAMGTLVIRAWDEPHQKPSFRARLTYSHAQDGVPDTATTADPEEVLRIVQQWLSARRGSGPEA